MTVLKSHNESSSVIGTYPQPLSQQSSSRSSGMCLSERGPIVVPQPEVIQNVLIPVADEVHSKVAEFREVVAQMLDCKPACNSTCKPQPLLVIVGPSYVYNPNQLKACARWVGSLNGKNFTDIPKKELDTEVANCYNPDNKIDNSKIKLAIRANMSQNNVKPPHDVMPQCSMKTYEIEHGIPFCRALMCEIAELCPIVGEISDTITPQYLSDLYSLGLISSTLIESQLHREIVSGISYPVGFRTVDTELEIDQFMYSHRVTSALDAMFASSQAHQFLSVTKIGTVGIVGTTGNEDTFLTLSVNDQFNQTSLIKYIDQISNYKSLNSGTKKPSFMLDVGKLTTDNFDTKFNTIRQILLTYRNQLLGIIIDSGDSYVPSDFEFSLGSYEDRQKLNDINSCFVKNGPTHFTNSNDNSTSQDSYNHLIFAHRLIQKLSPLL